MQFLGILHIAGELNVADLGTRGKVKWEDMEEGKFWQAGPSFLQLQRKDWPVTADIHCKVPKEELANPVEARAINVVKLSRVNTLTITKVENKEDYSLDSNKCLVTWDRLKKILHYSNSMLKVEGIITRLLRLSNAAAKNKGGWSRETHSKEIYENLWLPLTMEDYSKAKHIMLLLSQEPVEEIVFPLLQLRLEDVQTEK